MLKKAHPFFWQSVKMHRLATKRAPSGALFRSAPFGSSRLIALDLVEVHVLVDLVAIGVDHADVGHVLFLGRDLAQA